jgi:hypothetical protein
VSRLVEGSTAWSLHDGEWEAMNELEAIPETWRTGV